MIEFFESENTFVYPSWKQFNEISLMSLDSKRNTNS